MLLKFNTKIKQENPFKNPDNDSLANLDSKVESEFFLCLILKYKILISIQSNQTSIENQNQQVLPIQQLELFSLSRNEDQLK